MPSGDFPASALETRADWGYTNKDNLSDSIKSATTFNIGDTSLTLNSSILFPAQGFIIVVSSGGTETCFYSSNNTATGALGGISRGLQGSAEINHLPGDIVYLADSGGSINRMAVALEAVLAKVGINGSVVATSLTKKIADLIVSEATNESNISDLTSSVTGNLVTGGNSHDHNGGDGAPIPTGGIADNAVTTAKLANNSATQRGITKSDTKYKPPTGSGWADTAETTALNIATTLVSGDVYISFSCMFSHPTDPTARLKVRLLRNDTPIGYVRNAVAGYETTNGYANTLTADFLDVAPAAGGATYRVQITQPDGTEVECVDRQLIVIEMMK